MSIVDIPREVFRNISPKLFDRRRVENGSIRPSADQFLEKSIKERASKIAATLTKTGEQRFGPMWSEGSGVLPNGRKVHLQSSVDALEINLGAADKVPQTTHVRYDLTVGRVNTYEVRQLDGQPVIFYNVSSNKIPPPGVLKSVGEVLTQVELIAEKLKT